MEKFEAWARSIARRLLAGAQSDERPGVPLAQRLEDAAPAIIAGFVDAPGVEGILATSAAAAGVWTGPAFTLGDLERMTSDLGPAPPSRLVVRGEAEVALLRGACREPGPAVRAGDLLLGLSVEVDPTLAPGAIEFRDGRGKVTSSTRFASFDEVQP